MRNQWHYSWLVVMVAGGICATAAVVIVLKAVTAW